MSWQSECPADLERLVHAKLVEVAELEDSVPHPDLMLIAPTTLLLSNVVVCGRVANVIVQLNQPMPGMARKRLVHITVVYGPNDEQTFDVER